MLDQENNFYLISLSILITCLVDNVWLDNKGRRTVQCWSLLGVKLSIKHQETNQNGLVFLSLKRHWLLFDMLMSAFYPKQDFKFLQSALVWKIFIDHWFYLQKSQDSNMCYKTSFAWDNILAGINLLTLLLFFFSLTIALYFKIICPKLLIRHSNSCLTSLNSFRCALDSEHSGCCDYWSFCNSVRRWWKKRGKNCIYCGNFQIILYLL